MMNFDGTWRMHDSVAFEPRVQTDDTTVCLDEDASIDWNRVPTTTLDSHRSFFGTDTFYSLAVTVAKPIEQEYVINDESHTFYKPDDELSRAAWSVENTPWTIEHPARGHVTMIDQIKGVFSDSWYDWANESLEATLNIPTTDHEARDYLRESDNVSIGFYNKLDTDYNRAGVTAAQRDLYIDHVASVQEGRCSDEDGCKVHTGIQ